MNLIRHVLRDHRFPALAILFLLVFVFTLRIAYAPSTLAELPERYDPSCVLTTSGCPSTFLAQEKQGVPLFDVEIKAMSRYVSQREIFIPITALAIIFLIVFVYSLYFRKSLRG